MSDPISGVVSGGMSQSLDSATKQLRQNQGGGTSFQSVLEQSGGQGTNTQTTAGQTAQVQGSNLPQVPEQARLDLLQRVGSLPPGAPNIFALLPELLYPRTKLTMLQQAMNGVGNSPKASDVRGQLAKLESEYNQIDSFMKSNKGDLSQGELLFWQQRLYQVTQHVEVMSKVVDQATGGIKTILNTNI